MVPFFSLLGQAIQNGQSRHAFNLLLEVGLDRDRAWALVEGWDRMVTMECTTGWTPEVTAIGFVMNDVAEWWEVPYRSLLREFQGTAPRESEPGLGDLP